MRRREEAGEVVRPDTIVVASGKYGSCTQYAKWLISSLGCDAIEYSRQTLGYVSLYHNVIYIGAIRDAEISNVNIMWQNYGNFGLEGRKIIVLKAARSLFAASVSEILKTMTTEKKS